MAVTIHSPATCLRCGQTLPTGSRVKRAFHGYTHQQHCVRPVVATVEAEPLATERQVAYAQVVQEAASPSERLTVAQLRALTRSEISRHITIWQGL